MVLWMHSQIHAGFQQSHMAINGHYDTTKTLKPIHGYFIAIQWLLININENIIAINAMNGDDMALQLPLIAH